jgi:hypothetical protein
MAAPICVDTSATARPQIFKTHTSSREFHTPLYY